MDSKKLHAEFRRLHPGKSASDREVWVNHTLKTHPDAKRRYPKFSLTTVFKIIVILELLYLCVRSHG